MDHELACVKAIIDGMIADGRVDPERVYMGGESMGCIFTMTFGNTYPGVLAAEILMDGGPFDVAADEALEDSVQKDLASLGRTLSFRRWRSPEQRWPWCRAWVTRCPFPSVWPRCIASW